MGLDDRECPHAVRGSRLDRNDVRDARQGRRLVDAQAGELVDAIGVALDVDQDAFAVVPD